MELLQLRYFYESAHTDTREVRRQITDLITQYSKLHQNSHFKTVFDYRNTDFKEHYTVYAYYSPKEYYGNTKGFIDFLKSKEI